MWALYTDIIQCEVIRENYWIWCFKVLYDYTADAKWIKEGIYRSLYEHTVEMKVNDTNILLFNYEK